MSNITKQENETYKITDYMCNGARKLLINQLENDSFNKPVLIEHIQTCDFCSNKIAEFMSHFSLISLMKVFNK